MRAVIGGVATNISMYDNGVNGDSVASDKVYTAVVNGQPSGTWVYYSFYAYGTNGVLFSLPSPVTQYVPAPTLTLTTCGGDVQMTVQPTQSRCRQDLRRAGQQHLEMPSFRRVCRDRRRRCR